MTELDGWQTLAQVAGEFEAQVLLALLESAEIEAMQSESPGAGGGTVTVLVRDVDLEAARNVMQENQDDFEQLDWDQLDDGSAVGAAPGMKRSMPLAARIAFLVTALVMLVTVIALVIAILA